METHEHINLVEAVHKIDARTLAKAIYWQWRHDQGDNEVTMREIYEMIAEVRAIKAQPLITVWRALSFEDFPDHDADGYESDLGSTSDPFFEFDRREVLPRLAAQIDWTRIGTSWTDDKNCAVVGGALDCPGRGHASIIFEAKIRPNQVDWLTTIWQRCTVYQEEKEIRLKTNIPVSVVATHPNILTKAVRVNTGGPGWDDKHEGKMGAIYQEILRCANLCGVIRVFDEGPGVAMKSSTNQASVFKLRAISEGVPSVETLAVAGDLAITRRRPR